VKSVFAVYSIIKIAWSDQGRINMPEMMKLLKVPQNTAYRVRKELLKRYHERKTLATHSGVLLHLNKHKGKVLSNQPNLKLGKPACTFKSRALQRFYNVMYSLFSGESFEKIFCLPIVDDVCHWISESAFFFRAISYGYWD